VTVTALDVALPNPLAVAVSAYFPGAVGWSAVTLVKDVLASPITVIGAGFPLSVMMLDGLPSRLNKIGVSWFQ
jgi:hypothetical protein